MRFVEFDNGIKTYVSGEEQGMIKVNDMLIHCEDIGWHVEGEHFFRRKSAVGYALCLIKEQHSIAKRIKQLDNELQKVKLNLDFYHKNIRNASITKKEILSHRISCEMPLLSHADSQLTSLLKTISI